MGFFDAVQKPRDMLKTAHYPVLTLWPVRGKDSL